MTIDEAKEWLHKEVPTEILLERIYEEFKLELEAEYKRGQDSILSRSCKSCKYITVGDEWTDGCSHKEIYDCYDDGSYVIPTDFGCNRWEQK